jgi:hypothetical protein
MHESMVVRNGPGLISHRRQLTVFCRFDSARVDFPEHGGPENTISFRAMPSLLAYTQTSQELLDEYAYRQQRRVGIKLTLNNAIPNI